MCRKKEADVASIGASEDDRNRGLADKGTRATQGKAY